MVIKFVDIHSHIQFPEFDDGRAELIGKMKEEGIAAIVVGTDAKTSEQAVRLAEKNENLFASVGLHPNDIFLEEFDGQFYRDLLSRDKVVAVGECGLDYFRLSGTKSISKSIFRGNGRLTSDPTESEIKQKQKEIFRRHIDLALEYDKPLMVHCRPSAGTMDAYEDLITLLVEKKKEHGERLRGDIHFFVGTMEVAEKFFALGFTTSFTGVITFANDYDEIVVKSPLEKILVETDCPFVAPVPYRGTRNEPVYVKEVVKRIAELKGISEEETAATLLQNTRRLFNI